MVVFSEGNLYYKHNTMGEKVYPRIQDKPDNTYYETHHCLTVRTDDGIRSFVYYNFTADLEYSVYPKGDKAYGLIVFYLYVGSLNIDGDSGPNIVNVGSPSDDLTYNR